MDAVPPREIAEKAVKIGVAKAGQGFATTFMLAVLAGAFVALGACFFSTVLTGSTVGYGFTRLLGGLSFCLGLILIVVAGAELFTGNALIIMATMSGRVSVFRLIRNWVIVYFGNFVGSILTAGLVYCAAQWKGGDMATGQMSYLIAAKKLSLPVGVAFTSGILCNGLVCLAVWLCYGSRSVTDKIIAIIFPITAFATAGFEHCVANMYFIPYGMMLARTGELLRSPAMSATLHKYPPSLFSIPNLAANLVPVTLGNIIGGALMVGAVYWLIYLRDDGETVVGEPVDESLDDRLEEFSNK